MVTEPVKKDTIVKKGVFTPKNTKSPPKFRLREAQHHWA